MADTSAGDVVRDLERQARELDKMADDLEKTGRSLKDANHEAVMREVWNRRADASEVRLLALRIRGDHNL